MEEEATGAPRAAESEDWSVDFWEERNRVKEATDSLKGFPGTKDSTAMEAGLEGILIHLRNTATAPTRTPRRATAEWEAAITTTEGTTAAGWAWGAAPPSLSVTITGTTGTTATTTEGLRLLLGLRHLGSAADTTATTATMAITVVTIMVITGITANTEAAFRRSDQSLGRSCFAGSRIVRQAKCHKYPSSGCNSANSYLYKRHRDEASSSVSKDPVPNVLDQLGLGRVGVVVDLMVRALEALLEKVRSNGKAISRRDRPSTPCRWPWSSRSAASSLRNT